jgi:hypothetical protein
MKNLFLFTVIAALIFSGKAYSQFGQEYILKEPEATLFPKDLQNINSIDINNDGFIDVIGTDDSKVYALMNNGAGTFEPQVILTPGSSQLSNLLITDFNGDGIKDLVLRAGQILRFYKNINGVYTNVWFQISGANCAAVADVNNDGLDDLVVGKNGSFQVYKNVSGETLELITTTSLPWNGPWTSDNLSIKAIDVADANLDGYPDIAIVTAYIKVYLYWGTAAGDYPLGEVLFSSQYDDNGSSYFDFQLEWAHLSNSGRPDIVVSGSLPLDWGLTSEDIFKIFKNGPVGFYQAYGGMGSFNQFPLGNYGFAISDINEDGIDDIVISTFMELDYSRYSSGLYALLGTDAPAMNLLPVIEHFSEAKSLFHDLHFADITSGPRPELIFSSAFSYQYGYISDLNIADDLEEIYGSFDHFYNYKSIDQIKYFDIDGDGNTELIYVESNNDTIELIHALYASEGQFDENLLLSLDRFHNRSFEFTFGDVNGDQLPDLVTSNFNAQDEVEIKLYIRNEDGSFMSPEMLHTMPVWMAFYETPPGIVDVDGDGVLDITFANRFSINNGTGEFGDFIEAVSLAEDPYGLRDFLFKDIDGDGIADYYRVSGSAARVSYNLGALEFGPFSYSFISTDYYSNFPSTYLEDLNGDELPEIISFGLNPGYTAPVYYFKNLEGSFESSVYSNYFDLVEPNTEYPDFNGFAEIEDINNDGLPDMFYYQTSQNTTGLFHNINASNFTLEPPQLSFSTTFSNSDQSFIVADLTNDGLPDFITYQNSVNSVGTIPIFQPGKLIFRPSSLNPENEISGRLFVDENENGVFDGNDEPITYEAVTINGDQGLDFSYTDGSYLWSELNDGTYTVEHSINPDLWELTTENESFQFELGNGVNTINGADFGFKPTISADGYEIDFVTGVQRCDNNTIQHFVFIRNVGTTSEPLKLTLQSPLPASFQSSIPAPTEVGSILLYDLEPIKPFHHAIISVKYWYTLLSDGIEYPGNLILKKTDGTVLAEKAFTVKKQCTGTANRITESVGYLDENLFLVDTSLVYTIRAQNIGEANAQFAKIRDYLSYHTDLSSFELVSFSHFPKIGISQNLHILSSYENTTFPGTMNDWSASEILLKYKIKVKTTTPVGTIVSNNGNVRFGESMPVALPVATNTLYSCDGIEDFSLSTLSDCEASIAVVAASSTQPYIQNYEWYLNETFITSDSLFTATLTEPGNFTFTLNVSNALCSGIQTTSYHHFQQFSFGIEFDGTHLNTVPGGSLYTWYLNDVAVLLTSTNSMQPVGYGLYKVKIKIPGDCSYMSTTFNYGPTFTSNADGTEPAIFPNPVADYFTISISESALFTSVTLINSLGQVCSSQPYTGSKTQIDVRNLTPGIYSLILTGENGTVGRAKVMVAR